MSAQMELPTHFTLNTGAKIPVVGFGTWQAAPYEVERAVEIALKSGYRHIDCASIYRNEAEVGAGLKNSGVDRKEVFITSKLWNTKHAPSAVESAVDQTLKDLGTDYLDLYLMHWPWYALKIIVMPASYTNISQRFQGQGKVVSPRLQWCLRAREH